MPFAPYGITTSTPGQRCRTSPANTSLAPSPCTWRIGRGLVRMRPMKSSRFFWRRSQAVRLPAAFRFDTQEVFIRKDPKTGDVILSRKPTTWDGLFWALQAVDLPDDFLGDLERAQGNHDRDPLGGWPR